MKVFQKPNQNISQENIDYSKKHILILISVIPRSSFCSFVLSYTIFSKCISVSFVSSNMKMNQLDNKSSIIIVNSFPYFNFSNFCRNILHLSDESPKLNGFTLMLYSILNKMPSTVVSIPPKEPYEHSNSNCGMIKLAESDLNMSLLRSAPFFSWFLSLTYQSAGIIRNISKRLWFLLCLKILHIICLYLF